MPPVITILSTADGKHLERRVENTVCAFAISLWKLTKKGLSIKRRVYPYGYIWRFEDK
jgi:hypothetical protein